MWTLGLKGLPVRCVIVRWRLSTLLHKEEINNTNDLVTFLSLSHFWLTCYNAV